MSEIDEEVRTTLGALASLIHKPEQAVNDTGVDIDLGPTVYTKEDSALKCYHFAIVNMGSQEVFVAFDSTAAAIDTTDTTNALKTYQVRLALNGGALFPDRISLDGYAQQISLKCASGLTSSVWLLIK